jgi:hypothetical protein
VNPAAAGDLLAPAGELLAHGIGGRQDLPIPFGFAVTGAAVALVVSFVALGVLWREPRLDARCAGRPLPASLARLLDSRGLRIGLRTFGVVATAYVAIAAIFGPDDALNPTAGALYVLLWVGLVPASLLLGPVWRLLNPLRALHRGLAALLRTDPAAGLSPLPRGLGYWPAAAGLFAFVWLELVAPDRGTLPVLRTWIALYAAAHLLASAWFGSRWFDRGDAFEAYSGLIGTLSPLGRRGDGRWVLRDPLVGPTALAPAPGLVATVMVMLGSTAYDGFSNVPAWITTVQESAAPAVLLETLGLLAAIGVFTAAYIGATLLAGRLGEARRTALPGLFAHSVVPIAVGYAIAHYYSLLVLEGQRALINLSDPLGTGANWLGTADRGVSAALVTPTGVATLQVVAVVVGHVVGVVLAHDRAVRLFPRRRAVLGQIPLLVLMVCYTVTGLLVLFAG